MTLSAKLCQVESQNEKKNQIKKIRITFNETPWIKASLAL